MTSITVNVDTADKQIFNSICTKMGMNISTAINVFIKTVNRTKKIPFEVSAEDDAFYSEENISHILRSYKQLQDGMGKKISIEQWESGDYGKN